MFAHRNNIVNLNAKIADEGSWANDVAVDIKFDDEDDEMSRVTSTPSLRSSAEGQLEHHRCKTESHSLSDRVRMSIHLWNKTTTGDQLLIAV